MTQVIINIKRERLEKCYFTCKSTEAGQGISYYRMQ
jgi:hypothetical protein